MQGPEIDNGRLSDVSAEAADGLSQLSQIAGTGNDAEPEIDSAFLTTRSALEQAWSYHAACDARAAAAGFAASDEGRAVMAEMDRKRRLSPTLFD